MTNDDLGKALIMIGEHMEITAREIENVKKELRNCCDALVKLVKAIQDSTEEE